MSYKRQTTSLRNGAKQHNLTSFRFFYDTPLTDYNNTIHFKSNKQRDDYFLKKSPFVYQDFKKNFNFIRDRNEIHIPLPYHLAQGINYCTFLSDFEDRRYYAFVNAIEYINDEVVKMSLVIDVVMTFTQGKVLNDIPKVDIVRQHLTQSTYNNMLNEIRNNDDVLDVGNKYYGAMYHEPFGDNYVLFQSSADLEKPFGTKKEPNLDTSTGITYDSITSPVDLYVMEYKDFKSFMKQMSKYPWITQNFQKVQLIPSKFIDTKSMEPVVGDSKKTDFKGLFKLKNNQYSKRWTLDNLEVGYDVLLQLLGVDNPALRHLVRNEYLTLELYSWDGDSLLLDAGKITEKTGVKFNTRSIIGYHNEVRVYPVHYNSNMLENPIRNKNGTIIVDYGSFLNKAIIFDNFASVPILIDNGVLQQSQRAYSQKNAESQLISNRASNIIDPNSDPKSKFYDAVAIGSNLSPFQLFSKFNDEYDYYQNKKAEYKDLALQPPEVTQSQMGNAFQIANGLNGLTMKIGLPTASELTEIKKYYLLFGYETDTHGDILEDIESMTICNYIKFSGTYTLPGIDPMLMEQLKALLEQGVRFWHYNGVKHPFKQDIFKNTFRK